MKVTEKDVAYVASLANLELTAEEARAWYATLIPFLIMWIC